MKLNIYGFNKGLVFQFKSDRHTDRQCKKCKTKFTMQIFYEFYY